MIINSLTPRVNNTNTTAFTLVEISVVLVVLGLLVGGILAGQSLIKAAELRAQIRQIQEYELAINLFKEKYFGLPGDIENGENYWPAQTTNGDGDGKIEAATPHVDGSYTTGDDHHFDGERPEFFRQLSLAELAPQQFDGSRVLGKGYPAMAINPASGIFVAGEWHNNGGDDGNTLYSEWLYNLTYSKMYLYLGVCNPSAVENPSFGPSTSHNDFCGTLTIEEMYQIEKKMDDGIPKLGKILATAYDAFPECTINNGAEYNLSEAEARTCNMLYEVAN